MVWEMSDRVKVMDKAAVHPLLVQVFDNELTGQVLPYATTPMEWEDQRLLGVVIVYESSHSFHDDFWSYVLTKEISSQVSLQTFKWKE